MRVSDNVVNRKKAPTFTGIESDVEADGKSPLTSSGPDSPSSSTKHTTKNDDNKEGAGDPLTKINFVLTIIVSVLFLCAIFFSSKEKKNAYLKYKMAQLEAVSNSMTAQKNALYKKYDSLTTTIAEEVGLVKVAHHESEVGGLKRSQELVSAQLKSKQTSIETLQEEIKKNKEELQKVKNKLLEAEMSAYDFCPKCNYEGIPGLKSSCEGRAKYIAGKGAQLEVAQMAVMSESPSCRVPKKPDSEPEIKPTEEEEEALLAKWCEICAFTAIKGLKTSCGKRATYLMGYGTPDKVAKLSVLKADPGCKSD